MISVRAYFLGLLLVVLGGCSASEMVQNLSGAPVADLSQPNYRRIVTDNLKKIFPKEPVLGEVEISGLRMVEHLKGPAWLTCLKIGVRENPVHYAIFIQNNTIIDMRASVMVDQCQKETYEPLALQLPRRNLT